MEFIKQYIKIINYSLLGLVFAFSSFYILNNAYHYLEVRKNYTTNFDSQALVVEMDQTLANISKNISGFNSNSYRGNISNTKMMTIHNNLKGCVANFNNETIKSMRGKTEISIIDVYNLRESYEDDILANCIVTNLYWTTTVEKDNFNSKYLVDNNEMMKLYVDSLLDNTSYLKKDLLNNSSYYFNTAIASASIKGNTKDGFYEVMNAYNDALKYVEFISEWFKNEVEGNYE